MSDPKEKQNSIKEEWVTAEALAAIIGVHPQTVRNMAHAGAIPCMHVGVKQSALRFCPAAVFEALQKTPVLDRDEAADKHTGS